MPRLLLLALALVLLGCRVRPPDDDPCDPNPCSEANRNKCVNDGSSVALCLCNDGFLARPGGACEPVSDANCPSHGGDSDEPDDCVARARVFVPGSNAAQRTIEPAGDYDFFSFSGTAGHVFAATAARTSGAISPRLDLFDPAGARLSWAEGTLKAELRHKLPSTAVYALRVMHSPLDPSVATGGYSFTLQALGPEDHGDAPESATAIAADLAGTAPTAHQGRFELASDQDWFRFGASTTQNYRLSFEAGAGLVIPVVSLFAPGESAPRWTAEQPAIDFDVPASGDAHLAFEPPAVLGTYRFTLVRSAK